MMLREIHKTSPFHLFNYIFEKLDKAYFIQEIRAIVEMLDGQKMRLLG